MEYADLAAIGGDLLDILFFWPTARPENSPDPELESGLAARGNSGLTPGRRHWIALLAGDRAEGLESGRNLQDLATLYRAHPI